MGSLPAIFKACLLYLSLCTRLAFSASPTVAEKCPQHQGTDPNDANARVKKFAGQDIYYTEDDDYKYKIEICQKSIEIAAVQQLGKKWKDQTWLNVGTYNGAHVTGGTDWLMIKYLHGKAYHSHCNKVERLAVVLITCDPGEQRGKVRVIEEYRNSSLDHNGKKVPLECYYLFELNHDAACSVKTKHLSPGSIMLIILIVVGTVYLLLGFLYQRYIAGAKGLEQIPNYDFWRDFGSLQADGCNFMCRCTEAHPTRYKTMDDALADDDDRDDTLLPM